MHLAGFFTEPKLIVAQFEEIGALGRQIRLPTTHRCKTMMEGKNGAKGHEYILLSYKGFYDDEHKLEPSVTCSQLYGKCRLLRRKYEFFRDPSCTA